ncbi:hypothetical protein KKG83_02725 [Candidatus Micrarchaeota archaeon]|nr:hypothetical protein [Candidatus Micrarchaeota archaeon]
MQNQLQRCRLKNLKVKQYNRNQSKKQKRQFTGIPGKFDIFKNYFIYSKYHMKVYVPNSAFLGNMQGFIKKLELEDDSKLEVSFNKQWMSLHPMALAMVASLGLKMNHEGKPIHCEEIEAKSKPYFARMGLLSYLSSAQEIQIRKHEESGRFIPLRTIKNNDDLKKLLEDINPIFHGKEEQVETVNYVLSELIRNVFEHSLSNIGAVVCVQNFKASKKNEKPNRISIGVADTGIGIKKSLSESYPTNNDLEAIKLALTPGVTGRTRIPGGTEQNAGAGLFFIKSIAKVNGNFFDVYSGSGFYKLLTSDKKRSSLNADPNFDKHSELENLPHWQGTVLGIDIVLEQTEPFINLLKNIREFYFKIKKIKKKSFYKRARFI